MSDISASEHLSIIGWSVTHQSFRLRIACQCCILPSLNVKNTRISEGTAPSGVDNDGSEGWMRHGLHANLAISCFILLVSLTELAEEK